MPPTEMKGACILQPSDHRRSADPRASRSEINATATPSRVRGGLPPITNGDSWSKARPAVKSPSAQRTSLSGVKGGLAPLRPTEFSNDRDRGLSQRRIRSEGGNHARRRGGERRHAGRGL